MKDAPTQRFEKRGRKSKILTLFLALTVIIILLLNWDLIGLRNKETAPIGSLGQDPLSAPAFILPDLNGNKIDLRSFKGKVILIEFWATWCGPCREEIPYLNELHKKYNREGLAVIGISMDRKEPEEIKKFLEKLGVDYPNLMGNETVYEAYSHLPGLGPLHGIPATFLIDRQGRVSQRFLGLTGKRVLEEAIKPLL